MSSFTLDRLLILQAGHCFARFSDGVSIWVGDAGLDCVVIDRDGSQLSYVPQYAPQSRSSIRQRLQLVFAIRNRFHPVPIALVNFVTPDASPYSHMVRWPRFPVSSLCNFISTNESIVHSCCRSNGSVFIEQLWPIEDCPNSWRHAVNLAVLAENPSESLDEIVIDMSLAKSRSRLSKTLYQHSTSLTSLDTALPDHNPVMVEWTPDGVWHVIDKGRAISATFASDHSILRSSNLKFFEHLSSWSPPALYSVEHIGEMDFASSPLPITSAIHRACRLLLHYRANNILNQQQGLQAAIGPAISSIKRHTCSVTSVGEFTCFEDGRISVRFFDRTIVHLNPAQQRLELIVRDGSSVGINLPCNDLSDDLISYVRSTIDYFYWVNMPPEERQENELKALERNKLILKELQLTEAFLNNC